MSDMSNKPKLDEKQIIAEAEAAVEKIATAKAAIGAPGAR